MKNKNLRWKDALFSLLTLVLSFLLNLLLVELFQTYTLTPMIFVLGVFLVYLSRHSGKVLTYSAIICSIWGGCDDGSIKKLQVNMANIRKKLGCKPGDNRYIINELGVGYRIQDA